VEFVEGVSSNERQQMLRQFQKGNVKVFAAILGAGGQGLNLNAASIVIFIDKSWSPAVNQQAQDRIYRLSQKKNVTIYELIARNTIEEKILRLLNKKRKIAGNLLLSDLE